MTIFELVIETINIMSLPANKLLAKTLESTRGAHIIGIQEADLHGFKVRLRKRWPHILGLGNNNTFSTPIVFSKALFDKVTSGATKLYDGLPDISLTRHMVWAVLEHKKTKVRIGVINLHGPVVNSDRRTERLMMRVQSKDRLVGRVKRFQHLDLPIVVTGDFNDLLDWLSSTGITHKRVTHGIDQILYVDSSKYHWVLTGHDTIATPSDHDTLRSHARLVTS